MVVYSSPSTFKIVEKDKDIKINIESNNKKVNIELIPNELGRNLDLEKWSLTKAILLIKKIKDVDINIL